MGAGALSCGGVCMKYLLFAFNIIFFISGAALLALGLWMVFDPNFNDYLEVISIDESNPYVGAAIYMLIAIGAFTFVVGFLGCCGACKESPCMLCTYIILLVVVLSAEVAVAILIIVNDAQLGEEIEQHMVKSVQNPDIMADEYEGEMSPLTASWHAMQISLKCCGGSGYGDYGDNPNFGLLSLGRPVPKTCCVLTDDGKDPKDPQPVSQALCMAEALVPGLTENTSHLYVKGCYGELLAWFDDNKIVVVCVALGVALLQVFGIIFACCVRREALKPVDYAAVKT